VNARINRALLGEVTVQQKAIDPRIDKMFGQDCRWAILALVVVWALYTFVFYMMRPFLADEGVLAALLVSGGLVMLFNAAAIWAMIQHYGEDRAHIYGLDLHYLDLMNQSKG
jgi:hypothetical protein